MLPMFKVHGEMVKVLLYIFLIHSFQAPHLLNPGSRIFLEKLTGSQLVKKFPTLNGT
jgi:hypothetical protein